MTKQIPLTRGKFTLVDDSDYYKLMRYKWYAHKIGIKDKYYAYRSIVKEKKGFSIGMHQQILGFPPQMCDHVNGNGLDNRRENLRPATNQQNQHNQSIIKKGSSKYKGVSRHPGYNLKTHWRTRITINNKQKYLGSFLTEKEAAIRYDIEALRRFGEFAKLNFPDYRIK